MPGWLRSEQVAGFNRNPWLQSSECARQIEWDLYLAVFAKRGLKDADGNPPTRNTASKTWQRTRAAIARERARKAADAVPPVSLASDEIAQGVRLPPLADSTVPTSAEGSIRPRMRLDIRPAQPLTAAAPQPVAATKTTSVDIAPSHSAAQQQIRQALDALSGQQPPMPRVVR